MQFPLTDDIQDPPPYHCRLWGGMYQSLDTYELVRAPFVKGVGSRCPRVPLFISMLSLAIGHPEYLRYLKYRGMYITITYFVVSQTLKPGAENALISLSLGNSLSSLYIESSLWLCQGFPSSCADKVRIQTYYPYLAFGHRSANRWFPAYFEVCRTDSHLCT